MDVQAGWHDSTAHVQGFSHLKREADNCDIIRWHHCYFTNIEGDVYKPWGTHLGFWLHYIQLHFVRSHRPSVVATSVPLEQWDYNLTGKCSLFVQLYMLLVILSTLSSLFMLFASNWVAYHPGSSQTQYQSGKDCNLSVLISACGINHVFGEPDNPSTIPEKGHIFWHPRVGSKRSGRIPEVWFNSVELWQFTTIP